MSIRPSPPALFAAVIVVGVAFTSPSLGQSTGARPTPADRAKQLFDQGRALYEQDQFTEAEAAYQRAWDLHRSHYIAANLGIVELQLGQQCDAVEHLQFAYDDFPPIGKAEEKERLLELVKKARREKAYLEVDVDVAGAEVRVDGKVMGISPLPRELCVDQGYRVVAATREGYLEASQRSHAIHGLTSTVDLHLTPRPTSILDGKSGALVAVGGGLTAVGLGLGIGGMVDANAKRDRTREIQDQLAAGQCSDAQPLCLELDSTLKDVDTSTNLAIAGFVGAGVAAVATGVYLFWPSAGSSADTPAPAVGFAPVVTGSSGGWVVFGQF